MALSWDICLIQTPFFTGWTMNKSVASKSTDDAIQSCILPPHEHITIMCYKYLLKFSNGINKTYSVWNRHNCHTHIVPDAVVVVVVVATIAVLLLLLSSSSSVAFITMPSDFRFIFKNVCHTKAPFRHFVRFNETKFLKKELLIPNQFYTLYMIPPAGLCWHFAIVTCQAWLMHTLAAIIVFNDGFSSTVVNHIIIQLQIERAQFSPIAIISLVAVGNVGNVAQQITVCGMWFSFRFFWFLFLCVCNSDEKFWQLKFQLKNDWWFNASG